MKIHAFYQMTILGYVVSKGKCNKLGLCYPETNIQTRVLFMPALN